ncbi:MAG: NUDIX domain-containing protein [Candidatus Aenigmatarchaeota archaeon]
MEDGKRERRTVRLVSYVLLERDGRILLGRRRNAFGAGCWSMPAGHIEHGESVIECARRELKEETGLEADSFEFVAAKLIPPYELNGAMAGDYVAFLVRPKGLDGAPENMEPDKNGSWEWFDPAALPEPLFPPVALLLECAKVGVPFLD